MGVMLNVSDCCDAEVLISVNTERYGVSDSLTGGCISDNPSSVPQKIHIVVNNPLFLVTTWKIHGSCGCFSSPGMPSGGLTLQEFSGMKMESLPQPTIPLPKYAYGCARQHYMMRLCVSIRSAHWMQSP
jgi:hypothetical protein